MGPIRGFAGEQITASDSRYDETRAIFNAMVDRRPAAIAQCARPGDVATAFDFARVHNLQVAVRGGGHNPAGHCVLDGGLVIDLSRLRGVEVDGDARIARAEGGSTWVDFDQATQAYGLVTPGGVVGSTGVCGLTSSTDMDSSLADRRKINTQPPRNAGVIRGTMIRRMQFAHDAPAVNAASSSSLCNCSKPEWV